MNCLRLERLIQSIETNEPDVYLNYAVVSNINWNTNLLITKYKCNTGSNK